MVGKSSQCIPRVPALFYSILVTISPLREVTARLPLISRILSRCTLTRKYLKIYFWDIKFLLSRNKFYFTEISFISQIWNLYPTSKFSGTSSRCNEENKVDSFTFYHLSQKCSQAEFLALFSTWSSWHLYILKDRCIFNADGDESPA